MGLVYYRISFIVISILLAVFLFTKKKSISSLYTALYIVITISAFGYLQLASSKALEEALLANKIEYLGGIFAPCLLFMCLCDFLRYSKFKYAVLITTVLSFVMYGIIISDLPHYYNSVELHSKFGVSYLIKDYGSLHILFYVYVSIYITFDIVFIVIALLNKPRVSYKTTIYFVVLSVGSLVSAFASRVISKAIDLVPACYIVEEILLMFLLRRMNKYNMSFVDQLNHEEKEFYGFFALDMNKHYLGCNTKMKDVFTDFINLPIDYQLPKGGLFDEINELVADFEGGAIDATFEYELNDKIYRFSIRKYAYTKMKRGYIIEINDTTKESKYINLITDYNATLERDVEKARNKIVLGMSNIIESRDTLTGGHVKRTSDTISIIISSIKKFKTYDISDSFCDYIVRSAPMHDLGKIGISDLILNKPGKYDDNDYSEMKKHPEIGMKLVKELLSDVENEMFVSVATNVAGYHHEKYDGTGYPCNLKGDEIPVEARIMALADVYDALVSERCYKPMMTFEEAREIILDSMGSHFDPRLEKVFLDCENDLIDYYVKIGR